MAFTRSLALVCTVMSTSFLIAEEQQIEVSANDSGRLYANYTHGDCCTLDAWDSNPSPTVWVETCSTMGGYCMGGKDVAVWMFQVPELPEGAELLDVRFNVNKQSGANGAATLYMRGFDSGSLGTYAGQQAYGSSSHSQGVTFYGVMAHSFVIPMSHFLDPNREPYVSIAIYRSTNLHMYNTGYYAPTLEFTVEVGPPCDGDVNDDGVVDGADLSLILGHWGLEIDGYDLDENGIIDGADLAIVLGTWGDCPE